MLSFYGCFSTSAYGQEDVSKLKEVIQSEKQLILGIDNRRTHLNRDFVPIYGGYIGIQTEYKFRLKLGISGMPFEAGGTYSSDGRLTRSRMFYLNLGEEYDFFIREKFKLSAYGQVGLGRHYFKKYDLNNDLMLEGSENVVPLEVAVVSRYYLRSWLSLNTGFGWRWVFLNEQAQLNNYFFKLGVGVDITKFYPKNWQGFKHLKSLP